MPSLIRRGLATAARRAVDRARRGGGATLVEAKCYRFLAHTTDDDDRTYRTREEVAERRKKDPVPQFERFLIEHGVLTPQAAEELKSSVLAETNEAKDRAEAMPYPRPEDLYTNLHEGLWEPWQ